MCAMTSHKPHDFLLKRLFRRISKKTSKLRITGLCEGNPPLTEEFAAQRASNATKMFPIDDVIMWRAPWINVLGCYVAVQNNNHNPVVKFVIEMRCRHVISNTLKQCRFITRDALSSNLQPQESPYVGSPIAAKQPLSCKWIHTNIFLLCPGFPVFCNGYEIRHSVHTIPDFTISTRWCHQMETFSASQALCVGFHRSPVNSPHKGQWRRALMFLWSTPEQTAE